MQIDGKTFAGPAQNPDEKFIHIHTE